MITNVVAVFELAKIYHPNTGIVIEGDADADLSGVTLKDGSTPAFTFSDVLAKKAELQAAEPMRQLRMKRTAILAESDWMANSDVTMSDAWRVYRQALRDLPANSPNVALDEQGNLINVTWPTKPE